MTDAGTSTWKLRRTFSDRFHETLPEIAGYSETGAVLDFITNSFEADAPKVEVTIDRQTKKLRIRDTGGGMATPERLAKFYQRGDSDKARFKEKGIRTPKGRKYIGGFAIAASLLAYVGKKSRIDTVTDGTRAIVEEDYEVTKAGVKVPDAQISETDLPNGTTIEIDLKDPDTIDLEELVVRASRELPTHDPDFELIIDNTIVRPPKIDRAKVFYFETKIPRVGRVHGEFYLTQYKIKHSGGVYLKVNERAVGDERELFQARKGAPKGTGGSLAVGMQDRTLAFVYADGLDKDIFFNRGLLKDTRKEVRETKEAIREVLRKIAREYDAVTEYESNVRARDGLVKAAEAVLRRFNGSDKQFFPHPQLKLELNPGKGTHYPVEIDRENGKLRVHTDHDWFDGAHKPDTFTLALRYAIVTYMARERTRSKRSLEDATLEVLDQTVAGAAKRLQGRSKKPSRILFDLPERSPFDDPKVIEPIRLYELKDLMKLTNLDERTIDELVEAGTFEEPGHKPRLMSEDLRFITGESIRTTLEDLEGSKLVMQVVQEKFSDLSAEDHWEFVEEIYDAIANSNDAKGMVKDIGKKRPYYVIPANRTQVFEAYLASMGSLGIKKRVYGLLRKGADSIFVFSLKIPKEFRDSPQAFYDSAEGMGFLKSYLSRDKSARIKACYLPEQRRIVGVVMSSEKAVLRRDLGNYNFEEQETRNTDGLYDEEYRVLRQDIQAGKNSFRILDETPDAYRNLLTVRAA